MKEQGFLASMCLAGLLATAVLGLVVLQHFPNSGDEWCYRLQAEIFSQGRLSVPSPPQREFFEVGWMINDGKFYNQHPPGWPLVLAAGVLAGVPWLVNPVLGAWTLLVIYLLGKHMYEDTRVATVAVLTTLGSPFFLFNSASYWAHSSSLLTLSLSVLCFVIGLKRASPCAMILGGLCGSLSFLIRPLEQVAVCSACGLFCLLPSVRRHSSLRAGVVFLGTHLVGVMLLLGYHTLQNGHPLVSGYQLGYGATGAPNMQWTLPTWHYIDDYLADLVLWTVPGVPLVAGGYLCCMLRRRHLDSQALPWDSLLLFCCVAFIVQYALVAYPSLVGYGPRYYYSLLFAVVLLAARGSIALMAHLATCLSESSQRWWDMTVVCFVLVTLGVMGAGHIARETAQMQQRMAFQRLVEAQGVHHAVVFIGASSGDFEPRDLTRNRLDFQGDIIYALDLGDKNRTLMEYYPGRRYYLYAYDALQKRAQLQEIVAQ